MSKSQVLGLETEHILTSPLDLRARAHDASHFLMHPRAVAVPRNPEDVAALMRACAQRGLNVTFRSGGTSLSGQASTQAVLADVRHHFDGIEIFDSGARVRVEPGVTINQVNAYLAPYARQLGPDPASSAACTVGGVVANNSSGMACGTLNNTYQTLESMVVVLASGTVIDTASADANSTLKALEPELFAGLSNLRKRILDNPNSVATIAQQFSMKNTMGYGLNSFTDFNTPADILAHIMIGSEGTLGFVASATFRTICVKPVAQTGLLIFSDLAAANQALPELVETEAATIELMDAASLRIGQGLPNCPQQIKSIKLDSQAALLVEYRSESTQELQEQLSQAESTLSLLPLEVPVSLSADPATRNQLWALRKGLYTAVASGRRARTTALLEDVVVPVETLGQTCLELGDLFQEYSYLDSVIFGHAKDGNIHFMITDEFDQQLERYERFTLAMVDLVLGHHGSLKAEHGTGRVMAPFVQRQYGNELYEVMRQIKRLFDPGNVLNAGCVISDDPKIHLKHIKPAVNVDPLVDACVECGYCEPVCPARSLTLTPRQRIAVQREIVLTNLNQDLHVASQLEKAYDYSGLQTCAADGMCATACPVGINTGAYVKQGRAACVPAPAQVVWNAAAKHWGGATHAASTALSIASDLSFAAGAITAVNKAGRRLGGKEYIPLWSDDLPSGGRTRRRLPRVSEPDLIYIPACVNSMFGSETQGVQQAFEKLCAKAGITLLIPANIDSLCCGTPWSSKGMTPGYNTMAAQVIPTLEAVSDHGRIPIVSDAASCTQGFERMLAEHPEITITDCVQFVAEMILPLIEVAKPVDSITLHPTCSSTQLGINPHAEAIARAVAVSVHIPINAGCCAFAGDRGMLHPELTQAATLAEAAEVTSLDSQLHASCNRTCEIGMTRATGKPYRHILEVLAELV
ncbi:MAG: FAD-binding oxidoreductase [Propionibacteriaceae bacterium]|nr:FAD-binding oxidoreductase [Propionibacteriaceae bacterium]